jgi:hypothetical protein
MIHLNYMAIVTSAVAVLLFAAVYYSVFAARLADLRDATAASPPPVPLVMGVELFKGLVLAAVVAGLLQLMGIADVGGAVKLGLVMWLAFPVALLAGSVFHEHVPSRLAAIHAGDWLAKLLIIPVIISVWR